MEAQTCSLEVQEPATFVLAWEGCVIEFSLFNVLYEYELVSVYM